MPMRKASYLFLGLGLLSPFATAWFVGRASAEYKARTGFDVEGMGLFGIVLLGAAATFMMFAIATASAIVSYRSLETPRAPLRKLELALFLLPLLAVVCFVYFGMLGGGAAPPPVIHTN